MGVQIETRAVEGAAGAGSLRGHDIGVEGLIR